MKKILIIAIAMAAVSCTSKEEKVAKLIEREMFETLVDFSSYEPIETNIEVLKNDLYGDTVIFDNYKPLMDKMDEGIKYLNEFNLNLDLSEIYSSTRFYFASSKIKFKRYISNADESWEKAKKAINTVDSIVNVMQSRKLDSLQYGWVVTHKFRCKDSDGKSKIKEETFFINEKCNKIIRRAFFSYEFYKNEINNVFNDSVLIKKQLDDSEWKNFKKKVGC